MNDTQPSNTTDDQRKMVIIGTDESSDTTVLMVQNNGESDDEYYSYIAGTPDIRVEFRINWEKETLAEGIHIMDAGYRLPEVDEPTLISQMVSAIDVALQILSNRLGAVSSQLATLEPSTAVH